MEEEEKAIDKLIRTVKAAVSEYDKSGDHRHIGATDGETTDCIRCNLVAALGYTPIDPGGNLRNVRVFTQQPGEDTLDFLDRAMRSVDQ